MGQDECSAISLLRRSEDTAIKLSRKMMAVVILRHQTSYKGHRMKQIEAPGPARIAAAPVVNAPAGEQSRPWAETGSNAIHFYLERIAPENRLRLVIASTGSDRRRQIDDLGIDTALDWIYRILNQAEPARAETLVQVGAREERTSCAIPRGFLGSAPDKSGLAAASRSLLRTMAIRQLQQISEKDVHLSANLPFCLILRLQAGFKVIESDLNTPIYWVRVRVIDGLRRICLSTREVARNWAFGADECELEIAMPGLDPGQFELQTQVVFPAVFKSEQLLLRVNVVS